MKKIGLLLTCLLLVCGMLFSFAACGEEKEGSSGKSGTDQESAKGLPGTKGLEFALEGKSYIVTGIGTATDTDIVIPATHEGKPVTEIGARAFENCTELTSVTIPKGVTRIGMYAFSECTGLTSVTIPDSVTIIGSSAFESCRSLTGITLPEGLTSIEMYAFARCSALTSITLPEGVKQIREYAFSYCARLTSVTVPGSVTRICEYAFSGCTALTDVSYGGSAEDWAKIEDYGGNDPLKSANMTYGG